MVDNASFRKLECVTSSLRINTFADAPRRKDFESLQNDLIPDYVYSDSYIREYVNLPS